MFKLIFTIIGSILVVIFGVVGYLIQIRKKKKKLSGEYEKQVKKRNYKWYNKWYFVISDNWHIIFYLASVITLVGVIITAIKYF